MRIEIDTRNRIIRVVRDARVNNDAAFESKHPRDKDGKFAKGGRASTVSRGPDYRPPVPKGALAAQVDFADLHPGMVKLVTNALQRDMELYPFMRGHFSFIGSSNSQLAKDLGDSIEIKDNVEGFYRPEPFGGRGRICFSGQALRKVEIRAKILEKAQQKDTTFHPPGTNTVKGIVDHEFGHAIWHELALDDYRKGIKPIHKYIIKYIADHSYDELANNLSGYAKTNAAEFFAEAFSELQNNPNPRPIAKKIGELLDKEIKAQKLDKSNERK